MNRLFWPLISLIAMASISPAWGGSQVWPVPPAYETDRTDTAFDVSDERGLFRLYDNSYAVLIIQGQYATEGGYFENVNTAATRSETLLTPVLEKLGFKVLIWRDLGSKTLEPTLTKVFTTLGYVENARFFFYYFGHTYSSRPIDDPYSRTFLVPVDAADPVRRFDAFVQGAVPISRLFASAKESTFKHGFFAIEACQAGMALREIAPPPLTAPALHINEAGWVTSDLAKKPVRQFLTAGNQIQKVPATNTFTTLLALALTDKEAVSNQDYFITGRGVIDYVKRRLKQFAPEYSLDPESATYPFQSEGDLVFGRIDYSPANRLLAIYADWTGVIDKVLVKPGMTVRMGDVLVTMDPRYGQTELLRRQAEVRLAKAKVDQLDKQIKDLEPTKEASREREQLTAQFAVDAAALTLATAELKSAQLKLQSSLIVAPRSGVVERVEITPGQRVVGGTDSASPSVIVYLGVKQ